MAGSEPLPALPSLGTAARQPLRKLSAASARLRAVGGAPSTARPAPPRRSPLPLPCDGRTPRSPRRAGAGVAGVGCRVGVRVGCGRPPAAARPLQHPGPAGGLGRQPAGGLSAQRACVWALAPFAGLTRGGQKHRAAVSIGHCVPSASLAGRGPSHEDKGMEALPVRDSPSPSHWFSMDWGNPEAVLEATTASQPSLGSLACKRIPVPEVQGSGQGVQIPHL
ncbi:uncharacterized protein LOC134158795 [Pezoporus occidentalis]|uniref:uncharacterized protein LOC134158795 n=1 Tax=Pezoporus occidentalis TaxID=407982 RepID=UPI002F917F5E